MKEAYFSEHLLVPIYQTARRHLLEDEIRDVASQKRAVSSIVTQIVLLRQEGPTIYGKDNNKHSKQVSYGSFISALY
jgi:hypothetical protein